MLLRYTAKNATAADAVEKAIDRVLIDGYRTADIAPPGAGITSTSEMGDLISVRAVELANTRYAFHAV
jgi:3-isopropylmalate dehydrogenase